MRKRILGGLLISPVLLLMVSSSVIQHGWIGLLYILLSIVVVAMLMAGIMLLISEPSQLTKRTGEIDVEMLPDVDQQRTNSEVVA